MRDCEGKLAGFSTWRGGAKALSLGVARGRTFAGAKGKRPGFPALDQSLGLLYLSAVSALAARRVVPFLFRASTVGPAQRRLTPISRPSLFLSFLEFWRTWVIR